MATIKSYTDIEQSKVLAEILPKETADFHFRYYSVLECWCDIPHYRTASHIKDLPCWSLAALLNILAKQDFIIKSYERNDGYHYNIDIPSRHCKIWFSSLLDAAFEMVCWLKKNGK